MGANGLRDKLKAEIDQLTEQQLADLYTIIQSYLQWAQSRSVQTGSARATDPESVLDRVLARMQAHSLSPRASHLSRQELPERS